jgi:RNA polymerase sigma-70 factor (ECF subfamily)
MESCSPEESSAGESLRRCLPLIYDDLRRVAETYLRPGRADVLQPTAVVHEAYLRLAQIDDARLPRDREHLFAILALAMRQFLASHCRAQRAEKRGGDRHRTTLTDRHQTIGSSPLDLIDLHDALDELARLKPFHLDLVVLRYFGGLTIEETARVLDRSLTTVKDEWVVAKVWLRNRLDGTKGKR